ncbi:putative chaperone protein EcpD [Enterobacter cancerogenus]|uniref:Putative chaperone protein EcpD n=1 Tax=Enterobacter cancerogenus TaxID=69218 RepID=A0A484XLE7_9ENTR|nr:MULTISPECIES: fimbria/pilus periplasmic chaperone [unclassified Enterobacter]MDI3427141.1 fimbria/pilus periplasmic chaperone [Enterobacter sp. V87_3]VFS24117.1 putative chaperone protein EcpD [Enterobacter cancerogenus]HDS6852237.1 fimbria/pilus periplasmic chaperone [Enterobacter cancerogenus]
MKFQRAILLNAFLFFSLATQVAVAGMTISGTRVIFPGSEKEQTVRTNNKNNTPTLVQVWVDDGNKNTDINNIKVPFTATPPVYRVEPGKGQSVRLIYNGMPLPQDRESVFWFNMLEIPPMNEKAKDTDRLELAFRTRIKIFYRPTALKSSSANEFEKLRWEIISPTRGIKVSNPTPYYFSFDSAIAYSGDTQYPLATDMIPPFGSKEFVLANKNKVPATIGSVEARLINDYGGVVKYQLAHSTGNTLSIKKQ